MLSDGTRRRRLPLPQQLGQADMASAEPPVVRRHRHVEALGNSLVTTTALEVIGVEHARRLLLGVLGGGGQHADQVREQGPKELDPIAARSETGELDERAPSEIVGVLELLEGSLDLVDRRIGHCARRAQCLTGKGLLVDCAPLPRRQQGGPELRDRGVARTGQQERLTREQTGAGLLVPDPALREAFDRGRKELGSQPGVAGRKLEPSPDPVDEGPAAEALKICQR